MLVIWMLWAKMFFRFERAWAGLKSIGLAGREAVVRPGMVSEGPKRAFVGIK